MHAIGGSVDPDPDFATSKSGEVVFLLDSALKAGASREYTLTFGSTPTTNPTKALVIALDGTDEGQDARIVKSAAQTFKYEKTAGAFSSLEDPSGADWIDNHPHSVAPGSAGEYRGVPNFERGHKCCYHPQMTSNVYTPLPSGPVRQSWRATVVNGGEYKSGNWSARFDVYPDRATITMEENADTYWMMYESGGPVGKSMADAKTQYIARPDGSQTTMDKGFAVAENKEAEQFYSMCDPATKQSMFFVHHEGNAKVYYTPQSTMTVFGFGRDPSLSKFPHGALDGRHTLSLGIVQNGLDFAEQQKRAKGLIHPASVDVKLTTEM